MSLLDAPLYIFPAKEPLSLTKDLTPLIFGSITHRLICRPVPVNAHWVASPWYHDSSLSDGLFMRHGVYGVWSYESVPSGKLFDHPFLPVHLYCKTKSFLEILSSPSVICYIKGCLKQILFLECESDLVNQKP